MAKLVSRLSAIADLTNKKVGEAVQEVGELIRDDAKIFAPFRTGKLRRGIRKRKKSEASAEVYVDSAEVPYAIHQEYGTSRIAGRFYLTQAFAQNEEVFKKKLLDAAKQASNG